jgi:hypothetical protein
MGTLFASRVSDALGASTVGGKLTASSQITPAMLSKLPAAVRAGYQQAVADGVAHVFLWGAVIAALAVIASLFIREVPLRSNTADGVDPRQQVSANPADEAAPQGDWAGSHGIDAANGRHGKPSPVRDISAGSRSGLG